ncbi:hypothetical protein CN577_28470, partial [Bacillus toyonensis]
FTSNELRSLQIKQHIKIGVFILSYFIIFIKFHNDIGNLLFKLEQETHIMCSSKGKVSILYFSLLWKLLEVILFFLFYE